VVQTRPGTIMASSDVLRVTVTRIAAGTDSTIIPETAELGGTIRTLSEHTRVDDAGFALEALTS
jgi:metal-dependent amidase/aminoacylase/carboxypeptidase family protein